MLVGLAALHASAFPSLVSDLDRAGVGAVSAGLEASWLMVSVGLALIGISAITRSPSDHAGRHLSMLHAAFAHSAWLILLIFLRISPPTLLAAADALLLTIPVLRRTSTT